MLFDKLKGLLHRDSRRHHLIITGTGRAGSSFLISLLTELGCDTGFPTSTSAMNDQCNAGMELDVLADNAPYIIKNPHLCDSLDEVIGTGRIAIDHALIPIRDLYSAAESRRDVSTRNSDGTTMAMINGGLWGTQDGASQEIVLMEKFYNLFYALAKHDIPSTLLAFPRFVKDPEYLYGKLAPFIRKVSYKKFHAAFQKLSQPKLVHDFRARKTDIGDETKNSLSSPSKP